MTLSTMTHRMLLSVLTVSLGASFAVAQSGTRGAPQMPSKSMVGKRTMSKIALEGYCPVCVIEMKKWERGNNRFTSTYDGMTYLFPNAAIKKKFDATPAKYVPVLGGDCIVCYEKMKKRMPGNIRFAAITNNRLYLFPSDREKKMFLKDTSAFGKTDLAMNGECSVCLVMANKHVKGSEKFTEVHKGFRYLFPSTKEQAMFRKSPEKFVKTKVSSLENNATRMVTFSGKSGCAGCEYGVQPIGSPDELGLAISTVAGEVIVVEDAHKLYPDAYRDRFQGQSVQVEGKIVQTKGKVSWLEPSSLRVLN